jgi:hypothetical protein
MRVRLHPQRPNTLASIGMKPKCDFILPTGKGHVKLGIAALRGIVCSAVAAGYVRLASTQSATRLLCGALLSAIPADFISAVLHFVTDCYAPAESSARRVLWTRIQLHHQMPENLTDIPDSTLFSDSAIVLSPLFAYALQRGNLYLYHVLLWLAVIEIAHKYAHSDRHDRPRPLLVRLLQKTGLFISGDRHAIHHEDLLCSYAILNGWTNPVFDVIAKVLQNKIGTPCDKHSNVAGRALRYLVKTADGKSEHYDISFDGRGLAREFSRVSLGTKND